MGKLRDDGVDGRGRRKSTRLPLVLVGVFVVVVALTVLISVISPLEFNHSQNTDGKNAAGSGNYKDRRLGGGADSRSDPYTPVRPNAHSSSGWSRKWVAMLPGVGKDEAFFCNRGHKRTDVCRMHGIVQLEGNSTFKLNAMYKTTPVGEMKVKPYTRKWEQLVMDDVQELTLRSERGSDSNASRVCDEWHTVPAVVFSTGGYTGNVYHEFNDGLIPLYITTQHLRGEVMFIVEDFHDWWVVKYMEILKRLSKYEIMDINNHTKGHCFLDVTAGLFIHDELGIDSSLMPHHKSIQDFRALLADVYPLEHSGWERDFPTYEPTVRKEKRAFGVAPRLVIIKREGSRTVINLDEVIEVALGLGFVVSILQPEPTTEMKKMFWLLDRCDVLIGVHGAALTHFLFMRPGSVFIQVVPLGTNWAARTYYGDPAKRLGLHYIEYDIAIKESSLSREYEENDPVLTDPDAVIAQGWAVIKEVYLGRQNVELDLPRFKKVLQSAKAKWKSDPAPVGSTLRPAVSKRRRAPPKGDLGVVSASRRSGFGADYPDQKHVSKSGSENFLL